MRSINPLSPEDSDWFCRNVLVDLAAFRLVAEQKRLGVAGSQLGKSSQSLGRSIRKVEKHLTEWLEKCELVDHDHPKNLLTTEMGDKVLSFARDIFDRSEQFLEEILQLQKTNEVRIATIYSSWITHGKTLEAKFKNKIPNGSTEVRFSNGSNYIDEIVQAVQESRVDIGLTSYPPKELPAPLRVEHFEPQEMMLVFPSSYAGIPKANVVELKDVIRDWNIKVVIYDRELDIPSNRTVIAYLRKNADGLKNNQYLYGQDISKIITLLEATPQSFSILPKSAVQNEVAEGRLKVFSLKPALPPWPWGIVYHARGSRPAVKVFLEGFEPFRQKKANRKH